MQNVQNNFTVENLVAKYRNYVAENCPKEYFDDDYQDKEGKWHKSEGYMPFSPDGDADEQLLVTMYKQVAGQNADERVMDALSKYAEKFYSNALTEEELSFLCSNFEEAVAFSFSYMQEHKGQMGYEPVPLEMIDIIQENVNAKKGRTVFVADAGNGDVASLFSGCKVKGYTSMKDYWIEAELWALTQIRLYSQGISSDIHICEEGCTEAAYLDDIDCFIWGTAFHSSFDDAAIAYQSAKPNSQMIIFMDERNAAGEKGETYDIRKAVVDDQSIKSIISFEYKDMWLNVNRVKIALLVEKKVHDTVHIENGITRERFDVPASSLDHELLWPSFYSTKRPDSGIPLSEIVTFVDLTGREVIKDNGDWVLPDEVKQMPVAVPAKMGKEYKDANLLIQDLDLAGSKLFDEQWKFWIRTLKEPCVLLYGNKGKTVVGYIREFPKSGMATLDTIVCLVPKDGIDVRYVTALLLTPEIKGQIESICQGSVNDMTFPLIMSKVLVPNHSDKEKIEFLSEANYGALISSQTELKQEAEQYKKSIRMRKHALTQSLSSLEAMFYALNTYREKHDVLHNKDIISRVKKATVSDAFEYIARSLRDLMPALEHIAEVEYTFAKPEWIDPEKFIEEYVKKNEKGWLNFKSVITWEQGHNQAVEDLKDPSTGEVVLRKGDSFNLFLFPKDALERVFKNIISNAKTHGYVDKSRNDYQLRFSWHTDGMSLAIEIENNGSPIPNDRDTASLLEYGVSTDLHNNGHNGIGCNEIDDIMKRYDGRIEIVSLPGNEFPVKYILTFNRSNNVSSFKL